MAVWQAARSGLDNFSVLVSHVLVPPAMTAILESPTNQVQAFLAAGHVCAVMGWTEYEPIAERYHVPIVVTGFEPLDLLEGILMAIRQLEEGRAVVENQYARAVKREGNRAAQETVFRVFEVGRPHLARHRHDPGVGLPPAAGVREVRRRGALRRGRRSTRPEHPACIAGQILQGTKTPLDCTAYGVLCSPQKPLGAPMVSSEGVCSAYHAAGAGLATADGVAALRADPGEP